jgi:hypothetical protein
MSTEDVDHALIWFGSPSKIWPLLELGQTDFSRSVTGENPAPVIDPAGRHQRRDQLAGYFGGIAWPHPDGSTMPPYALPTERTDGAQHDLRG